MTEDTKYTLSRAERAVFGLRALFESYGFRRFKVNKFEEYDFYVGCKSFLTSQNVLTFTDSGGKLMALKPDVTLSIVKNAYPADGAADKVYYSESVFRDRGDGNGFREITQTGLECVGEIDALTVCETAALAAKSLFEISSGRRAVLTVSHTGVLSGLLDFAGADPAAKEAIRAAIENRNESAIRRAAAGLPDETVKKLLDLCSVYGSPEEAGGTLASVCDGVPESESALRELRAVFDCAGDAEREMMKIDFSAAGDMDYYTGIVFRGYVDGIPKCVLSGGRYDGLRLGSGGARGGVGFAVFTDLLEEYPADGGDEATDADVFLLYCEDDPTGDVLAEAERMRRGGATVRAGRAAPDGARYGRVVRFGGK